MSTIMTKQRRGRGSIHRRGRERWLVRVTLGVDPSGKQVRMNKAVRGSKTDAEAVLTKLLGDRDGGLREKPSQKTLGEFVEVHLASRIDISQRTQNDERGLFGRYFWPDQPRHCEPDRAGKARKPRRACKDERLIVMAKRLRSTRLPDVTPRLIQAFVNTLGDCGLAPRTVRMMYGALRACLKVAVEQRALVLNPAVGVRLPRHTRREMKSFNQAEALKFVAAAEAGQDRALTSDPAKPQSPEAAGVYALFIVMLMSGLRVGEMLALRWADLDGATLRVRRAVTQDTQRRKIIGPTKTGRSRAVPLGERAMRALKRHKVAQAKWKLLIGEEYKDQGLIFASATGDIIQAENLPHRLFRQLLKGAELPALRRYDLRHSHATLLMAAGEHPKVVQERLGHSSIQLTLDTYSHVVPGMQDRATERLEALLATPAKAAVSG